MKHTKRTIWNPYETKGRTFGNITRIVDIRYVCVTRKGSVSLISLLSCQFHLSAPGFPTSKLKLRRRSNARRDCEHIFLVGSIKARRWYAFSSTDEAALRGEHSKQMHKASLKVARQDGGGLRKRRQKKREKRQREAGISRLYHLQQAVTLLVNYNRLPEERGIIL